MKNTTLLLLSASLISTSSAAIVNYTFNGATGDLTDTSTGTVFGTLVLADNPTATGTNAADVGATYEASSSFATSVTLGTLNFEVDLDNVIGNNVDVTYTFTSALAGYTLQSAQWGSGLSTGVLGGNSGSAGSTTGNAVGDPNNNQITLSSAGLTLTAGALNGEYSTTGSGSASLDINGADSNTNQLLYGSTASDFGEHWSSNIFTGNSSTLNYANSSTGNNNIQRERLALQLSFDFTPVPEPSSTALLGLGALGLLARRKR